jgi:hypothetical protein
MPGQTIPELTYDSGAFKAGIEALRKMQYGLKMDEYQPTIYSPSDFSRAQKQTPEEFEIYASWINLPATTRQNLKEFEQPEFQLPTKAIGREQVKHLV